MKYNIIYIIIICLSFNLLFSCSKDKSPEPMACEANPSFENEIKAIFLNNCTGCHNNNSPTVGVILEDYTSIHINIIHSMEEISHGTMPPSGQLSDSTISLLNCWIENGSPNN